MELVDFLRARLDEDEEIAKEAGEQRMEWRLVTPLDDSGLGDAWWLNPPEKYHAERHDPARVLAEVEAKRRILNDVLPNMQSDEIRIAGEWGIGSDPIRETSDDLLSFLALPYANHPDYQAEWRP